MYESYVADYPAGTGWVELDVTAYVQNWLDGTWNNHGFVLFDSDGTTEYMYMYSSDYLDVPAWRPKLTLDYTAGPAIEESTRGQLKAAHTYAD